MKTVTIKIDQDQEPAEFRWLLFVAVDRMTLEGRKSGPIRDRFGNPVGTYELVEGDSDA